MQAKERYYRRDIKRMMKEARKAGGGVGTPVNLFPFSLAFKSREWL